eukprot:3238469-Amphidinium_carterae.1
MADFGPKALATTQSTSPVLAKKRLGTASPQLKQIILPLKGFRGGPGLPVRNGRKSKGFL